MAKKLTTQATCEACGAEVRPDSMFCYNCGGPVAEAETSPKSNRVSSEWFKGDIGAAKYETSKLDAEEVPIVKPTADLEDGKEIVVEPEKKAETPLKTAASMRRKSKNVPSRQVGIVWEEPENGPNKWFPLVALTLVLFVLLIYFLADYLK